MCEYSSSSAGKAETSRVSTACRPSDEDASPLPMVPISDERNFSSMIPNSLLILTSPTIPASVAPKAVAGTPTEQIAQLSAAKKEDERSRWCASYDAAQPTGRSLSAQDSEFQKMLRDFRNSQPKKTKAPVVVEGGAIGEQVHKEERKKGWLFGRKLF